MLDFLTLHPKAFGLDISDFSCKIVQLEHAKNGFRLASFSEVLLERGIVEKGEIQKEDELIAALKKGLKKVHGKTIQTNYVIASLPEQKAFLQVVQLPKMEKEEVTQAVRFQAENYIPYSIDSVYLDHMIIPPFHNHIDHIDVLLASMPRDVVNSYTSVLEKAGLTPFALETESFALSRALVENGVSAMPILFLDLSSSVTNVSIFSGYSLRLTTSIAVSALQFTEAVQKELGINEEKAEELKRMHGLANEGDPLGKRVFEALVPVVTDFIEQIQKYMEYHESHMPHQHLGQAQPKIKKIVLSGGGANLRGLPDLLTRELKTEVVVGNPWVNILSSHSKEIPDLSFQDSLRFTTALGLALRGAQKTHD